MLNWFVFLCFGMLVARDWSQIDGRLALYAVLSLTVVRMLPVAIALRGTGLSRPRFCSWGGLVHADWPPSFWPWFTWSARFTPMGHTIQNAVLATVPASILPTADHATGNPALCRPRGGTASQRPGTLGETPPTAAGFDGTLRPGSGQRADALD